MEGGDALTLGEIRTTLKMARVTGTRRPRREGPMTARRLGVWLCAALCVVACVIAVDGSGLLSHDAAVVVDNLAQLTAGIVAAGLCGWTAWTWPHLTSPERTWRRFMALGMAGWTVGQGLWSWYQIVADRPLPSPSWADVGYLSLPVLALPALLVLASGVAPGRRSVAAVWRRPSVVLVLDGLVVVGALFVVTWSTALGSVVRAGGSSSFAFGVAIAYPVSDLVLVVIVVLLTVVAAVPRPLRPQLWLVGSGLVALAVSDSIFAYLVSHGAGEMPPVTNAGFVAGPLLIGVAALVTSERPGSAAGATTADVPGASISAEAMTTGGAVASTDATANANTGGATVAASQAAGPARGRRRSSHAAERVHLALPYVLMALTGGVIVVQRALDHRIDPVEGTVSWIVLGLVLVRQIVSQVRSTVLLERFEMTQAELAYRAQHDPLTGLANRELFGERLQGAVDGHRERGRPCALLLVDLDDFKVINDSLGHAAGDALLHAVAQRLRACVRTTDTVARLGGDEFGVVLDGREAGKAATVAHRIVTTLHQPFLVEGRTLSLGASVGVVEPGAQEVDVTPEVLLRRADGAMYRGKRRGKGTAVVYDPNLEPVRRR
jgi:diguanylate cyclase (GGDEF)-like protein